MSNPHRTYEMAAVLQDLRQQACRLVDVMAMSKVKLGQVALYGGAALNDYRPDDYENLDDAGKAAADADAQARLDEMNAAVAAANAVLGFVATNIPETDPLTIEQAILRITDK